MKKFGLVILIPTPVHETAAKQAAQFFDFGRKLLLKLDAQFWVHWWIV